MGLLLLIVFVFAVACFVNKRNSERDKETNQSYCEVCVRWSECNGVDESCPWR